MDPENGQTAETANTWVVHFPVKAPETAVIKDQMSAIEQCEYWKTIKLNWTEHNPSVTISYKENEVEDLIQWVKDNKQFIGGMSFLPVDNLTLCRLESVLFCPDSFPVRKSVKLLVYNHGIF